MIAPSGIVVVTVVTVEVEDVYDDTGKNKITVENNVYTFTLTPSYYLDSRIETSSDEAFVTVNTITKGGLWGTNKDEPSEEYIKLRQTVKNLDSLDDNTVIPQSDLHVLQSSASISQQPRPTTIQEVIDRLCWSC